jgi:acetylornithine/N-succinyldiaminopimelate aminotransferase
MTGDTVSHLFDTYARMPLTLVRGEGPWLFDDQGRRFLDAVGGIAVCSLGHAHPRLARVLCEQARTLWHTANIVHIPQQEALAEALTRISGLDRAFMANSGVEAIECALKLARRHAHARGVDQPKVLVTGDSFHGRSLAALSASGNLANQAGFGPLVEGFVRVPYGDLDAARQALDEHEGIVAMLLEPIQGEGGVKPAPPGYLTGLREACDHHQALMMLDEIQTGMCRTGRWFAFQHEYGLLPDVVTVAKALGNGMPIGACLARAEVAALFTPGLHGTTFGGNPLASRVGLEVIRIMKEERIAEHSEAMGGYLTQRLCSGLADHPVVVEIRGRGLMIGIELTEPATALKMSAMEKGLIINVTRGNIIRLLPPLIIEKDQANQIADTLIELINRQFPQ